MPNNFNTIQNNASIVAKAAAGVFAEELGVCKNINKVDESDFKGKNGYSAGNKLTISKPAQFIPQSSFDITSSKQDVVEDKASLTLDLISTVGINLTSSDLATEIQVKEIIRRIIKPAASAIAHDVENRIIARATHATFNCVGTAGSTSFDTDTILSAKEKLDSYLCPKDGERNLLLNSSASRLAVNARKLFNQSSSELANQYKKGVMGVADGFNWMESQMIRVHTNGNDVTGVQVNDAAAVTGASTLAVDGLTTTTGTVKRGQIFTIAGVYAVHPVTKTAYPFLQQFVVTADVTANGSGQAVLAISPTIYSATSKGLQNVSALPANDANITFVGSADQALAQNLAFHKNAFRMVSVPLEMPNNAEFAAQETVDGITIAIIRDFDVNTRSFTTRLDFLGGFVADRPEWACRITA